MGHTLAEKIIMKNTGLADLHPGDLVTVTPDRAVVHDIYTKSLYEKLMEMGFEKAMYPERLIIFHDHLNPACLPTDPDSLSYGTSCVTSTMSVISMLLAASAISSSPSWATGSREKSSSAPTPTRRRPAVSAASVRALDIRKWHTYGGQGNCGSACRPRSRYALKGKSRPMFIPRTSFFACWAISARQEGRTAPLNLREAP